MTPSLAWSSPDSLNVDEEATLVVRPNLLSSVLRQVRYGFLVRRFAAFRLLTISDSHRLIIGIGF